MYAACARLVVALVIAEVPKRMRTGLFFRGTIATVSNGRFGDIFVIYSLQRFQNWGTGVGVGGGGVSVFPCWEPLLCIYAWDVCCVFMQRTSVVYLCRGFLLCFIHNRCRGRLLCM